MKLQPLFVLALCAGIAACATPPTAPAPPSPVAAPAATPDAARELHALF